MFYVENLNCALFLLGALKYEDLSVLIRQVNFHF